MAAFLEPGWIVPLRGAREIGLTSDGHRELRDRLGGRAASRPAYRLVRVAVEVGFEPTEACTSHAFEACALGH